LKTVATHVSVSDLDKIFMTSE